ncbi:hypothetical protein [Xanthomonas euvesicatoria]|uniref:hypothetical protein n=1 Tax=Xanthomonas euvesicatoria TaxID=456327 RepID=UPI000A59DDD4|nr:hypothetical protein [Xanthomonas euvesicatoria]MCC8584939.1 hypothetical protein [Xanthomonas euvesicatoria pv. euvesicatoria]MCC8593956.1 hypothetical protein [Xanthomonas euvesicatoria pv. euvesicatoria]MCC8614985.1 hypothetical protein [Xanthomonas euvesicatoria pv. euvesicatoria]
MLDLQGPKLHELYSLRARAALARQQLLVAVYDALIEQRIHLIGNTPAVAL